MPVPFRIVLRTKTLQSEEVCEGTISDADWQLIEAFRAEAARLREAEWVRAGLNCNYRISGGPNGVVIEWPDKPMDAAVRELLHLLRPFVLQNEPTYFDKVTGRLWTYFDHRHIRNRLAEHRQGFRHRYGRAFFEVAVSNTLEGALGVAKDDNFVINDGRAFDLWVNSFEYHRDSEKRRELIRKLGSEPDEMTLTTFRHMIADKAEAVLSLGAFLDDLASSPTVARALQSDES